MQLDGSINKSRRSCNRLSRSSAGRAGARPPRGRSSSRRASRARSPSRGRTSRCCRATCVNAMYIRRRGSKPDRGVNVNARGRRPAAGSPAAVTEIQQSRARRWMPSASPQFMRPQHVCLRRGTPSAARSTKPTAVGLPADSYHLAAERGPPRLPRHRFMSMANVPLPNRFRLGTSLRAQSACPTTSPRGARQRRHGRNDRPAAPPEQRSWPAQLDLAWSQLELRSASRCAAGGPQIRNCPRRQRGSLSTQGARRARQAVTIELYAQCYNS